MKSKESDDFKKSMKKALLSNKGLEENTTSENTISTTNTIAIDLPKKKPKLSGHGSFRCTRETEETIERLMHVTRLSQSQIVNHLVELSLPILTKKYLDI